MNIKSYLSSELEAEFDKLDGLDPGSEEHKAVLDGLVKLMDRAIEIEKIDTESEDRAEARRNEELMKQEQLRQENIDRWVKNGINLGLGLLTAALTVWGTKVSLNFEKEGTVTTIMGRGFINKLLPKK